MGEECLAELALLNIHKYRIIQIDEIILLIFADIKKINLDSAL